MSVRTFVILFYYDSGSACAEYANILLQHVPSSLTNYYRMCRVHQQIATTCAYDLFLYAPHAQTKLIGSMA
jgi:hypothetical protein